MIRGGGDKQKITVSVTGHELQREARRLLPLLASKGAFARMGPRSKDRDCGRSIEIVRRPNQKRPTAKCEQRVIEALLRQEWIVGRGTDEWTIGPLGLKLLARMSGGEEGFRAQHQVIVERSAEMPDGSRRPVRLNEAEDPLAWLRRHKMSDGSPFLNDQLYAAGERLYADFTKAHMQPSVTTNWSQVALQGAGRSGATNGVSDLNEAAHAAKRRFEKALTSLGPEMASATVDICCFCKGLGEVERARNWPKRSAKLILRLSLDQLARHYGLLGV